MIELYRSAPRRLGDEPTPPEQPPPDPPATRALRADDLPMLAAIFGPTVLAVGVAAFVTWRWIWPAWWKFVIKPVFGIRSPRRRR